MDFIERQQELARRQRANDDLFFREYIYFFELVVPSDVIKPSDVDYPNLLFPLMLPPDAISFSDPFTVRATPGLDGNLYVEENGITRRTMRISGTTGFEPRAHWISTGLGGIRLDQPSFGERGKVTSDKLSGQRHLHFLQDKVFRTYGDLKRDPIRGGEVQLIWHNPKDEEHWNVVPIEFRLDRDARRPTLYNYTIDLLITGVAKKTQPPSPDAGWFKKFLGNVRKVVQAVKNSVAAGLVFVQKYVGIVSSVVEGVASTIDAIVSGVTDILTGIDEFIQGTANAISQPLRKVSTTLDHLSNAITQIAASPFEAADTVLASFRQLEDSLCLLKTSCSDGFYESGKEALARLRKRENLSTTTSSSALSRSTTDAPTSLSGLARLGTAPIYGDADRVLGETDVGIDEPEWRSTKEHRIGQGETLRTIANKYFRDPRRWKQLAILNNLQPPYITEAQIPGTLGIGGRLLIPSTDAPLTVRSDYGVIGSLPTDPLATRLYGRDLQLAPSSADPRRYDLVIDEVGGRTDAKLVEGIDDLKQAIIARMMTERGTDPLYPLVGAPRLVGLGLWRVDKEIISMRIAEAVAADPRVASVKSVEFNATQTADVLEVDVDVVIAGLDTSLRTTADVGAVAVIPTSDM